MMTAPNTAIREHIHLAQDGDKTVLYIVDNEKDNADIHAYIGFLRSAEVTFIPRFVTLTELSAEKDKRTEGGTGISLSRHQQRVIDYFEQAMKLGSSDIHMTIDTRITRIEMRIHGDLELIDEISREQGLSLASTICMSMCDVAEKQFFENRVQAGRIKEEFLTRVGLFGARYSHQPCVGGLEVVMRVIPHETGEPPTPESLGFLPRQIATIRTIFKRPEGIIINSGPTGSGKSTTLRALCNELLQQSGGKKRLTTVEDPPEGKIPGAIQCPIDCDKSDPDVVSRAWVVAITTTRRQDPDILMIGEIQNLDSAKAAIAAASTGHRVLSTLHANDAVSIPDRLIIEGLEPERVMDSEMMIGLISQRLVKVNCPDCSLDWESKKTTLTREQITYLTRHCDVENIRFIHPEGCENCHHGVTGRTVISEVIHPDTRFMSLLHQEGKTAARTYWHRELHGITRVEHLKHHINAGRVDPLIAEEICPLNENDWLLQPEENPDITAANAAITAARSGHLVAVSPPAIQQPDLLARLVSSLPEETPTAELATDAETVLTQPEEAPTAELATDAETVLTQPEESPTAELVIDAEPVLTQPEEAPTAELATDAEPVLTQPEEAPTAELATDAEPVLTQPEEAPTAELTIDAETVLTQPEAPPPAEQISDVDPDEDDDWSVFREAKP
ncbi:pilus assembly protein [Lelliottia aquatilis]|uniref:GspE/PulE family protein n=1 Tax=Lelliottia aquatilis TaxID=2080838 RepID=UPI0015751D0A|nr:ATPase, T2SS/T4P/T4SS family [Lelliottia aquatilis]NTZ47723.1 pilus assembly protein [Lelliottia aquatilis]